MNALGVTGNWLKGAPQRTWVRLVAALVAIALAALGVLLAHDIRTWRNTMRDNAIRYSISPASPVVFTAPTYLPDSISGRLLAVYSDRRTLSALRFFAFSNGLDTSNGVLPGDEQLLQKTERSLSLAAETSDPARAAQAYSLLAVILLKDSRGAFVQDLAPYAAAISALQNAVRVDPGNQQVTADLELLLRQFRADSRKPTEQQANNQGSKKHGKTIGRGKGIPPVKASEGDY